MITHRTFDNGFKYLEIKNDLSHAKIALYGSHIFEYQAIDKPALLWLSRKAYFDKGKAIRGGIPLCFPWFGKHEDNSTLPQHGFARTALWEVVQEEELEDGSTHIRLQLGESPETLAMWAYAFELNLDITVGKTLKVEMHITNTDTKPFEVSTALHTYFNVTDIAGVNVEGLENTDYYDALTECMKTQKETLTIDKEVDRVYQTQGQTIKLNDKQSYVSIEVKGSSSLVVWNPWKEKSITMADMSNDGYKTMLCLETSNAREDTRAVEPSETHSLEVEYRQNGVKDGNNVI